MLRPYPSRHHLGWITLALIVLTIAMAQAPGRYQVYGPDLLSKRTDTAPARGFATIGARGGIEQMQLRGLGAPHITMAGVRLPPLQDIKFLQIQAQVYGHALTLYNNHWGAGGIAIHSYDIRGEHIWYWPSRLAQYRENSGWRTVDQVWPVATQAHSIQLFAYILSDPKATLTVRDLRVKRARERRIYQAMDYGLWTAWTVVLLAWLLTLTTSSRQQPRWYPWPCHAAVLTAVLIITAGLTPHPHLGNTLDWGQARLASAIKPARTWLASLTRETYPASTTSPIQSPPEPSKISEARAQRGHAERPSDGQSPKPSAPKATHTKDANAENTGDKGADAQKQPRQPVSTPPGADRLGHAAVFTCLTIIALLGWRYTSANIVLGCVVLTSMSVQTLQSFIITRDADLLDLAFDFAGIAAGAVLVMATRYVRDGTIGSYDWNAVEKS